jgi:DNA-binding PadR family transcriptional regulator
MALIKDIPTDKEQLILADLIVNGRSYGLQLVRRHPKQLAVNSIYVILTRMLARKLVTARHETEKEQRERGPKRRLFKITPYGRKMYEARVEIDRAAARATRGVVKPAGAF